MCAWGKGDRKKGGMRHTCAASLAVGRRELESGWIEGVGLLLDLLVWGKSPDLAGDDHAVASSFFLFDVTNRSDFAGLGQAIPDKRWPAIVACFAWVLVLVFVLLTNL